MTRDDLVKKRLADQLVQSVLATFEAQADLQIAQARIAKLEKLVPAKPQPPRGPIGPEAIRRHLASLAEG